MRPETAVATAQDGLIWLAGQPAALARFLETGGIAPEALRARVADPEFLGFVLDFLLGNEAILLAFCADAACPPTAPALARAALPGGNAPHWT